MTTQTIPFHESVVVAINSATTPAELSCLQSLILSTTIPKNHRKIRGAWNRKAKTLFRWAKKDLRLPKNLRPPKKVEKKAVASKKTKN